MIHLYELGAPEPYSSFRPAQEDAFERLLGAATRFPVCALATGVGKSLIAWCYSRVLGVRTVILTSTNGLLDQYERDALPGVVDMRGMRNYPCRLLKAGARCDTGPCLDGEECVWKGAGCAYHDAWEKAKASPIVVSNYDFWFAHQEEPFGPRDLLVCDEAHDAADKVCKHAGAAFSKKEVMITPDMAGWTLDYWRAWGADRESEAKGLLEGGRLTPSQRRDIRALMLRFGRVARAGEDWAWDLHPAGVRLEPVSARSYAEPSLFRGVPRVLLMSATLRPTDLGELGLTEYDYMESPSPFPARLRPIYWIECGVRVNAKISATNLEFWANCIDQFIAPRLGEKGIIHTVSYQRARYLGDTSRHRDHMILHESDGLGAAVEKFKKAKAPAILVSPSTHTGYDYPEGLARWQVIAKVPFPDCRAGISKARRELDDHYDKKVAARVLEQAAGRIVRGPGDWGETAIIDDSFKFLYHHYRAYFSRSFRDALRMVRSAPEPIKRED